MKNCTSCGAVVAGRSRYCEDCRDTKAPWRPDDENIARAAQHLGISFPVRVRRTNARRLMGRYSGLKIDKNAPSDPAIIMAMSQDDLNEHLYHQITVAARMLPVSASRILWHELTHAKQFEEYYPNWFDAYAAEFAKARRAAAMQRLDIAAVYRLIPFEIEAQANEDLHYTLYPLTKENKRANMPALKKPHHRVHRVVDGHVVLGRDAARHERMARACIADAKRRRARMSV